MYTTYILQNDTLGRYYIGSSNNIVRRLNEHNRGQTKSTRRKGTWKLIYKEEYKSVSEAKKREIQIKSYKGGNAFKKLVAGVVQQ